MKIEPKQNQEVENKDRFPILLYSPLPPSPCCLSHCHNCWLDAQQLARLQTFWVKTVSHLVAWWDWHPQHPLTPPFWLAWSTTRGGGGGAGLFGYLTQIATAFLAHSASPRPSLCVFDSIASDPGLCRTHTTNIKHQNGCVCVHALLW